MLGSTGSVLAGYLMTSILENHYVYDRNLNLIICQIIFGQGWWAEPVFSVHVVVILVAVLWARLYPDTIKLEILISSPC